MGVDYGLPRSGVSVKRLPIPETTPSDEFCFWIRIIGGALMSFLPTSNRAGCLAGLYLVNAVVAPLAVFYQWTAANVAGPTKRAFAAAMISGAFSVGNILGPQTFRARDAPAYRPAKLAVMGTLAGCAATTATLFLYYFNANRLRCLNETKGDQHVRQNEVLGEEAYLEPEVWADMTDKQNRRFRYTY